MLGAKDRDQYKSFYDKQGSQGYSNCHLSEGWERITPQVPYYKGKVFEAGTQTGGVTKIIAKYAEEVVTCELSSSYFETASKNLYGIPNISIIHGFAEDALEQFPGYFDVICLNEILEHVLDDGLLVAKSFAALKDGGLILFSTPLEGIFPDTIGEHTRQYSIRSILELFEPYHHSLRIEPTDCPIWIVGMAWKKESPKRTFMKNLGVWHT